MCDDSRQARGKTVYVEEPSESEKVPIFSPENGPNEVSPICLKMVRIDRERPEMYGTESTKCTIVTVFLLC